MGPFGRGNTGRNSGSWRLRGQNPDEGFTLVELLIVVTILPMIVGALSLGLVSILSLQSGVANRLANTADSQVVSASYQNDIQAAAYVTTAATSTPQCGNGTGTQLLGLESNLNQTTGVFQTTISYVSVTTTGTTPTYTLERLFCDNGSYTPSSTTTLSYNLQSSQSIPFINCVSSASSLLCSQSLAAQQWISAQNIADVTFTVVQPEPGHQSTSSSCATGSYCYSLTGSPVASASSTNNGSPFTANTTTSCGFASPNTGAYSGTLCFVNFAFLKGAALAQATGGGCLELSVSLPGNYTMYFCLQITGPTVLPWYLPT
jgi:prepilin-type N-terminal cleavage/methylation domain-containing protein